MCSKRYTVHHISSVYSGPETLSETSVSTPLKRNRATAFAGIFLP